MPLQKKPLPDKMPFPPIKTHIEDLLKGSPVKPGVIPFDQQITPPGKGKQPANRSIKRKLFFDSPESEEMESPLRLQGSFNTPESAKKKWVPGVPYGVRGRVQARIEASTSGASPSGAGVSGIAQPVQMLEQPQFAQHWQQQQQQAGQPQGQHQGQQDGQQQQQAWQQQQEGGGPMYYPY